MSSLGGVAIVTGGNRGIGLEIARTLLDRGASVCIAGRDLSSLQQARQDLGGGDRVAAVQADVTSASAVRRLVDTAAGLGPIRTIVNNAAAAGPTLPVHETPPEEFQAVIATNLIGPFLVSREVLPGMIERQQGAIINIGSVAGVEGYPLRSPYCASKWGLHGLTRTLAGEVGPHGITVNLVAPGPTEGDRSNSVISKRAQALGRPFEELREEYASSIPLRRFVRPHEVAETVAFLASPAASGITGQSFCVSGGIEI